MTIPDRIMAILAAAERPLSPADVRRRLGPDGETVDVEVALAVLGQKGRAVEVLLDRWDGWLWVVQREEAEPQEAP